MPGHHESITTAASGTGRAGRKLKILHTMTWLARGGGVDNNVLLTFEGLKDDYELHLAVGAEVHHDPFKNMEGIRLIVCLDLVRAISPFRDLKALIFFYRLIRKEGYDIVHTHETKAGVITKVAAFLAGTPYIIYGLHGVTFNDPLSRLRRWFYIALESLTIRASDLIVAVSQDVIDQYKKNRIGAGIRFVVVYSGIDIARFDERRLKTPSQKSALRRALGFSDDNLVLVNIGRFSEAKAQRYTIEAFCRLKARHAGLKLLLVGEGELKQRCVEQAQKAGLSGDVVFYGYSDAVAELLSISDIFVLTSLREGLPRVVVESYVCEVPAVSFEVEGIREIIDDGKTGYIVRQADIGALVSRLETLMDSPQTRATFGHEGHRKAVSVWDHRKMMAELRRIYDSRRNHG